MFAPDLINAKTTPLFDHFFAQTQPPTLAFLYRMGTKEYGPVASAQATGRPILYPQASLGDRYGLF